MVQHDFLHMSFFKEDFKEFVDTLIVALRQVERMESPARHLHPVVIRNPISTEEISYGVENESSKGSERTLSLFLERHCYNNLVEILS
ncbi:MAG: hypothetical protein PHP64_01370 [Actinomycetota bacterium]|nr:hypothetical protein [Actinomycetota bacterium]